MQNYYLNTKKLDGLLEQRGQGSLSALASRLGVHRNTLGHFRSKRSIIPESLVKLFNYLGVDGRDFIEIESETYSIDQLAPIVDGIIDYEKSCCVVLFGSRARGTNKKFSDFDLGIYSKKGIKHNRYLEILEKVEELSEDFPIKIQIVNLTRADREFIKQISPDVALLGGRYGDFIHLKASANER